MPSPLPNETAVSIRIALSAGRKLDAIRLYREATGVGLAEAAAFVDQLESGSVTTSDAAPAEKPAFSLTDHGWLVEPTDEGGVRLRRSALWRRGAIGCSCMVALFSLLPLLIGLWWYRHWIWNAMPAWGVQVVTLFIPLLFVGLFFTPILWQILRLALWREEWEGSRDTLIVRRGVRGRLRRLELRGGELVIEPHLDSNARKWRLAVVCDGEKHYLLHKPDIRVGFRASHDMQAEANAIANLLAEHTGWNVSQSGIAIEGGWNPPSESNEDELLAALRSHHFVADFDEQHRLTISPPKGDQIIGGVVLLAVGIAWLWKTTDSAVSFINDVRAKQQSMFDSFDGLIFIPLLMIGALLCFLGLMACIYRVRWTVDHNLLLVRSRDFGWLPEREYVNARWKLTKVRRTDNKNRNPYFLWQLRLENASGRLLEAPHFATNGDDDIPRLLGTLFAQRTGWPLHDFGERQGVSPPSDETP